MIVAGVMSGTSADGINVALLRVDGKGAALRFSLLGSREIPYPAAVRKAMEEFKLIAPRPPTGLLLLGGW